MKRKNTDLPLHFSSMVNSILDLFKGRLTYSEIMQMDNPTLRSMVHSRLKNMEETREAAEKQKHNPKGNGGMNFSLEDLEQELGG